MTGVQTCALPILSGEPSGWLTDVVRSASGRVASLKLGGAELSGGAARSLFSLRSTAFDVSEADGTFTFSVTGYGHGVGLSQYGANALAKQGKGWREILAHYYTDKGQSPFSQIAIAPCIFPRNGVHYPQQAE